MFIGTDITEVNRVQYIVSQYKEKFLKKFFLESELKYCYSKNNPFIHLCGTFSVKESLKKALLSSNRIKSIPFKDIEILRQRNGSPYVEIHKNIKEINSIKISISHTNEYATSFALVDFI
tara:strand:- start:97 stop:456 length:360 start_codon:yes stop_codon:yes gene_type:complete